MDEEEVALEPDPVFLWVRKQLEDAGLTIWDAGRLALASGDHLPLGKVDWQEIKRAIDAGCPLDLVTRIWL